VVCHRDPERYALLYQLVWRILHGERALLEVGSDPLVHRLHLMRKEIAREIHKMHAFVRFRQVDTPEGERYVAWFEPEHFILEAVGPFFRDRFGSLTWSILTPLGSMHWNRAELVYGPPATRADAPDADAFESGWRAYYESVFNPARINAAAMRAEMPKRYWKNLPEAQSIPALVRAAGSRVQEMVAQAPTQPMKRRPDAALARMHERSGPGSLEALNLAIAGYVPPQAFAPRPVLGRAPLAPPSCSSGNSRETRRRRRDGPLSDLPGSCWRRRCGPSGSSGGRRISRMPSSTSSSSSAGSDASTSHRAPVR
jgi:DNA polymerase